MGKWLITVGLAHQFRTRNDFIEQQRTRTKSNENAGKSTKPIDILPLITVWLQVRVLLGPLLWDVHYNFRVVSGFLQLARYEYAVEKSYAKLKARWLAGERDRELGLRLMFFAWMHWADPPFVTGLEHDPAATSLWREAFAYFSGESSIDAEFLFVAGIMAELFPWALGDEKKWEQAGSDCELAPRKWSHWDSP